MDTETIVNLLKSNSLFKRISERKLRVIAPIATTLSFAPDEILMKEGDPALDIFVIYSGEVEVLKKRDISQYVLTTLGPGNLLGEYALLDDMPRTATIRAKSFTRVIIINVAKLKALTRKSEFASLYVSLFKHLSEKLRTTNEFTVQVLEKEISVEKDKTALGKFLLYVIFSLCLFAFVLKGASYLVQPGAATTLISFPLITIFVVVGIAGMHALKFPPSFYGFNLDNWQQALKESLLVSFIICALIVVLKWFLISFIPGYESTPLFNPYGTLQRLNLSPQILPHVWFLLIILYSIHSCFQEIIVRGFLQSGLQVFLTGKYSVLLAILASNIIFSSFHLVFSFSFAGITFIPGLIWGWLYARQKTLLGVMISHILIGVWMGFIVGLGKSFA